MYSHLEVGWSPHEGLVFLLEELKRPETNLVKLHQEGSHEQVKMRALRKNLIMLAHRPWDSQPKEL